MFKVSLSAYQQYQRCEQAYDYSYVKKIRPLYKDVAPQRGIVIHEYLDAFYSGVRNGLRADEAHGAGLTQIESHATEFDFAASLAFAKGNEEDAIGLKGLLDQCLDLARRYYNEHGRSDAERYDVLLIEERIELALAPGISSVGVADLVLRDRVTGRTALVEHKTTGSVPEVGVRLWDFQTTLYAFILRRLGQPIDGTLWNYIRTKPPVVPELLKARRKNEAHGGLTRRADLDTNWETYEAEILRHGLSVSDYSDVRERLLPRERDTYFPRYEHALVTDAGAMLEDYAQTAQRMRFRVDEWAIGRSKPIRTLSRGCQYCQYKRVCEAAIMGGDEEDVIKSRFRRKSDQEQQEDKIAGDE